MSLDLLFVPRTPSLETLVAPDYVPTAGQKTARRKLVAALLDDYPDASLQGDPLQGHISGLPGDMELRPGAIFWSVKHAGDQDAVAQVQGVVDWFKAHRLVCEDPQDAGFGNRRAGLEERLDSIDALVGAQLQGLQFDRNSSTALILEWILPDGRHALQRLAHVTGCELPNLAPLVKARVASCEFDPGVYDDIAFQFDSGHTLRLLGCIPDRLTVKTRGV